MKSHSIFTVLLLAMFLNIFHDFTIEQQVNIDCCTQIELLDKSDKCHKVDTLHHFFHFFALALTPELELLLGSQNKPIYDSEHPPRMVLQSSFKPPKS